ncbi:MAG: DUF2726 domain-containing protein [bacterium]
MININLWQIFKDTWEVWAIILGLVVAGIIVRDIIPALFGTRRNKAADFDYKKRDRVLNDSEQALYFNLQKSLGDSFIVLSKVRIEDFVEAKSWGLRGKIKSRHVDFLICDMASSKPLLAVELDGLSHNTSDWIERDQFVDELYKNIGLPVEHIRVGSDFSVEAIRLRNILKPNGK